MMDFGKCQRSKLSLIHLLILDSLVNGGILAQNDPKRHYKYQLLDPVDKPYATIRFYYRTKEFLTVNGIATSPSSHTRQPSTSSDSSHAMSDSSGVTSRAASKASSGQSPPGSVDSKCNGSSRAGTPPTDSVAAWLRHHRLQKYTTMLAPLGFERLVTLSDTDLARIGIAAQGARGKLLRELADYKQQHVNKVEEVESENAREKEKSAVNPTPTRAETCSPSSTGTSGSSKSEYIGCCIGSPGVNIPSYVLPSERAEHFGANTTPDPVMEDSIEKLTLPAPPFISISAPPDKTVFCIDSIPIDPPSKTLFSAPADKTTFSAEEINPIAPTTNSAELISPKKSPKKAPPKSLKVQINNVDFELEKEEKEPFSPFTSGGMLRHLLGPTPPSAPARITAFGPTIDDQLNAMREECRAETPPKQKFSFKRTTRAERCSGRLSKILGKAMGRA